MRSAVCFLPRTRAPPWPQFILIKFQVLFQWLPRPTCGWWRHRHTELCCLVIAVFAGHEIIANFAPSRGCDGKIGKSTLGAGSSNVRTIEAVKRDDGDFFYEAFWFELYDFGDTISITDYFLYERNAVFIDFDLGDAASDNFIGRLF